MIVPAIVSSDLSKSCKNWARLIQKVYNVDPKCKYCNGKMRILFVEDEETIEKIFETFEALGNSES